MESKWRNFVHTPSFSVWKARGEVLYTRLLLAFGKHREKFCAFGEELYIFECDQSLLEKRVCILTTSFVDFGGYLVFECFGISLQVYENVQVTYKMKHMNPSLLK